MLWMKSVQFAFLFQKWVVGSPCRAVYSEDGELYEAKVTKIFENTGTCMVEFIGTDVDRLANIAQVFCIFLI